MKYWIEVKKVAAIADLDNYLNKAIESENRAMLVRWKKELLCEINEQSDILKRYYRLINQKRPTPHPIISVKLNENSLGKNSSYKIPCPGCNLMLPTADICCLHTMESPVYCQRCFRILYSDGFYAFRWELTEDNIKMGEMLLSKEIDLGKNPNFVDMYGQTVSVNVNDGIISNLANIFRTYDVVEGDILKLRTLSLENNEYAFIPAIKSNELTKEDIEVIEVFPEITNWKKLKELHRMQKPPKPIEPIAIKTHKIELNQKYISKGFLKIPSELASRFEESQTIKSTLRPLGDFELKWYSFNKVLHGLFEWYSCVGVEPGDYVYAKLERINPAKINIWTEWQRDSYKIIEQSPEDFTWQEIPIRDCLIFVFKKINRNAHYRDLYSEISRHRELAVGSIIGTLSKYRSILFNHIDKGIWCLVDRPSREGVVIAPKAAYGEDASIDEDKLWNAIEVIESQDLVFKILKHRKAPLSFTEMCRILGKYLKVEPKALRHAGFLNAEDLRLHRDDTGYWLLKEWLDVTPCPEKPEVKVEESPRQRETPLPVVKNATYSRVIVFGVCLLFLLFLLLLFLH